MNKPRQPESELLRPQSHGRGSSKADYVTDQIAQLIVGGQTLVGDYLATENDLSHHYQVSRPNIRQAIHRLSTAGLVETRHGVGTYVCSRDRWNLFDPLILDAFVKSGNLFAIAEELVELRRMVEVECAGLAALQIKDDELREMNYWLEKMDETLDDIELVTQADLAFHEVIIRASRNRFLQGIMRYLKALLRQARLMTMETAGHAGRKEAQQWHGVIYRAIAARHEADAREAMIMHMQQLKHDIQAALSSM